MKFSQAQLDMMQAYAYGFAEGDNNRRYLNEYPKGRPHEAFKLGYNEGIDNRFGIPKNK